MAVDFSIRSAPRQKPNSKVSLEYRLIFLVSFAFFLVAALVENLLPWTWARSGGEQKPSLLGKAWNAAEICTTYAFMG